MFSLHPIQGECVNIVQIIDNGECNPFDTEEINNNNIFIYRLTKLTQKLANIKQLSD